MVQEFINCKTNNSGCVVITQSYNYQVADSSKHKLHVHTDNVYFNLIDVDSDGTTTSSVSCAL